MNLSDNDSDLIARPIVAQSGPNASADERAAIASVVLNRVDSPSFGNSVRDVLFPDLAAGLNSRPGASQEQ